MVYIIVGAYYRAYLLKGMTTIRVSIIWAGGSFMGHIIKCVSILVFVYSKWCLYKRCSHSAEGARRSGAELLL